jgi:hypothetical protein
VNEDGQIGKDTFPPFECLKRGMKNLDFSSANNSNTPKIIISPIFKLKALKKNI